MLNIVRLNSGQRLTLLEALSWAEAHDKSVRILTDTDKDGNTFLKYDIGNTGWTPPLYGEEF